MLAHDLWRTTGQTGHLGANFRLAARLVMATITAEQDHAASPYVFERLERPPSDTLSHSGRGSPVGHTGKNWSGFRPSDDACLYHYPVPANMMAAVALQRWRSCPWTMRGWRQGRRRWRRRSGPGSLRTGWWITRAMAGPMPVKSPGRAITL